MDETFFKLTTAGHFKQYFTVLFYFYSFLRHVNKQCNHVLTQNILQRRVQYNVHSTNIQIQAPAVNDIVIRPIDLFRTFVQLTQTL